MFNKIRFPLNLTSTRSNFAWAILLQIVEKGAGYIVLAVLTRVLLKTELGTMFYALSISGLVAVLLNFGTDTYLIRKVASDTSNGLAHLSSILSIRIVTVILGYGILNFIVWQIQPELIPIMLLASAYDFLEEVGHTFLSFFAGEKQVIYRLAVIGFFKILTILIVGFIAIFTRMLIPVLWAYIGLSGLFVLSCFWMIKHSFGKIEMKWEPQTSFYILKISAPFFWANYLNMMHMRFDTILVGSMLNMQNLANYELGIKLIEVMRFMVRPFNLVFLPVFSEYYASLQLQKLRARFWLLNSILFGLGILLAMLMNIFGSFVIHQLFGNGYSESVLPTQILFISLPFLLVGTIATLTANAIHQEKKTVLVLFIAVLVNIGLNLIAIPRMGIIGAAWVTVFSQFVLTLGMLIVVIPYLSKSDQEQH